MASCKVFVCRKRQFQFLIGTIITERDGHIADQGATKFQFLIGTIITLPQGAKVKPLDEFQFLIGTIITILAT